MSYQDYLNQLTQQLEAASATMADLLAEADDNIAGDLHWLMREISGAISKMAFVTDSYAFGVTPDSRDVQLLQQHLIGVAYWVYVVQTRLVDDC